jgi:hypothetical protein
MLARVLVPIVVLAVWSGCGQSDEERAEQVVKDYNRAYLEGDTERACALTTQEFWADIKGTCEEFIAQFSKISDKGALERLATGDYEVTIEGDEATVQGHNLGIFTLRKGDGDWKLTSVR